MKTIKKHLKNVSIEIASDYYKTTTVKYLHSYGDKDIYTGKTKTNGGRIEHAAFLYHTPESVLFRVQEGCKNIDLNPDSFSFKVV